MLPRRVEEPLINFLGPAVFKMVRILLYVVVSVHLVCCMYYRVKLESSPVRRLRLVSPLRRGKCRWRVRARSFLIRGATAGIPGPLLRFKLSGV